MALIDFHVEKQKQTWRFLHKLLRLMASTVK